MTGATITLIIVVGILIVGGLLLAWRFDKRRADAVAHDPERLDVDPDITVDPVETVESAERAARAERAAEEPHHRHEPGLDPDEAPGVAPRVEPGVDPDIASGAWGDDPYGRPPADRGMR